MSVHNVIILQRADRYFPDDRKHLDSDEWWCCIVLLSVQHTCLRQICADCKYWPWKYITNLHYMSVEPQNLISVIVCIFGRSVPDGLGGDCKEMKPYLLVWSQCHSTFFFFVFFLVILLLSYPTFSQVALKRTLILPWFFFYFILPAF